mmetsp:Transcript_23132/g.68164  ORF Transcript_23132/g.68164 Transcript_23132/m.68164 type:complete len:106 (+) Transcript_23132:114-431(+)
MTWEDLMNCICQTGSTGLGLQDVLSALERHTLCTGTRCFEDEADLFGTAREGAAANPNAGAFVAVMMMLMAAAAALHYNRPTPQLTNKGGEGPNREHDDEPPAIS